MQPLVLSCFLCSPPEDEACCREKNCHEGSRNYGRENGRTVVGATIRRRALSGDSRVETKCADALTRLHRASLHKAVHWQVTRSREIGCLRVDVCHSDGVGVVAWCKLFEPATSDVAARTARARVSPIALFVSLNDAVAAYTARKARRHTCRVWSASSTTISASYRGVAPRVELRVARHAVGVLTAASVRAIAKGAVAGAKWRLARKRRRVALDARGVCAGARLAEVSVAEIKVRAGSVVWARGRHVTRTRWLAVEEHARAVLSGIGCRCAETISRSSVDEHARATLALCVLALTRVGAGAVGAVGEIRDVAITCGAATRDLALQVVHCSAGVVQVDGLQHALAVAVASRHVAFGIRRNVARHALWCVL